jgi:hypothetical protein
MCCAEWPLPGAIPREGSYLLPTTWRDLLDATITVGRDVAPWLATVPHLAQREILARQMPLQAYLERVADSRPDVAQSTQHVLVPNSVYTHGTEITARGAFSYRVGMTMAEWICRGWLGLGPTTHAESAVPPGADPDNWRDLAGKPDLFGTHSSPPRTWLVEVKAARRLQKYKLTEGAQQLAAGGRAHGGPHRKVLCGTSLEDRLFMTLDVEDAAEAATNETPTDFDLVGNDAVLYTLARSRMLVYFHLLSAPTTAMAIVPVGSRVPSRPSGGLQSPLEFDTSTRAVRDELADLNSVEWLARRTLGRQVVDMLAASVPGTGLSLGLSRRLYGACSGIAAELRRIASAADEELGLNAPSYGRGRYSDGIDEAAQNLRFELFREMELGMRPSLQLLARQGFLDADRSTWADLLRTPPSQVLPVDSPLLESATQDTYLAIDRRNSPLVQSVG